MSEHMIRVTLPWKLNYHNEAGDLIPYGPGEDVIPVEMAEGLVREGIIDESVLEQEPATVELEGEVVETDTEPAEDPSDVAGEVLELIAEKAKLDGPPTKSEQVDSTTADGESLEPAANTQAGTPLADTGETMLPQEFPARDLLVGAGFVTVEGVAQAEDETLSDIKGIGPATLEEIREAQEQPEDYQ